jgi:hypothetical protein
MRLLGMSIGVRVVIWRTYQQNMKNQFESGWSILTLLDMENLQHGVSPRCTESLNMLLVCKKVAETHPGFDEQNSSARRKQKLVKQNPSGQV